MPGDDKAVARAGAAIVLVLLAIFALRGYLPGTEAAVESREPEPEADGPGSVIAVLAMLVVSMTIIAISVAAQSRRRPAIPAAEEPRGYRSERLGPSWRLLAIAAAGLLVWLLLVLLLMRWGAGLTVDEMPLADPDSGAAEETGSTATAPPESPRGGGGDVFGYLAAATVTMLVLAVVAAIAGRRRTRAPAAELVAAEAPDPGRSAGPDLARATELGLAEIGDRSRDPREAIIACYAAMERELEKSPGTTPQLSDTPSEVLARAVARRALPADSAAELVDLFEEARFSPHVMNEGHREAAVRALRLVQQELPAAP
ncbi:DUF4129 domain-containing protein [Mycolicibacterium hippocampi]|uniref:Protein-glutamine gamma-glutamyltransferase-like C-terminal domain-containing protein n=1 Tax=Mycolicibacterium hippocampi TaxID=659824 RepID=A0A7I9ZIW3_9MYCO|nr:DUF4129 domain-containing protein [Mycolicibacterium hippocampi]GFH00773.1 hypothetical protein MHIP_12560 [Mycolicibacterium hippocampi]